ncbi:MAG: UDP-N-acetylglucosamine--N-acetylmuramyl-(pentapeptide) pyrophosphoryl-undecaprenol N-acetylglucosamine transferase [Gemmatimonadota bacterium]
MTTVLLAGGGTGGHLMPALAIARATARMEPDWRFSFAGAERGIEARLLPERELPHRLLPLEPLHRRAWWKNLRWLTLAPRLIVLIDRLLDAETPSVVIGTGGYVSGPVLWRAARRGIPTGILELDVHPGFATRRLAGRVDAIWTATPETIAALPPAVRGRAQVTGAPIEPPDRAREAAARERFGLDRDRPVLVITGGSQGSRALNRLVATWLSAGGGTGWQVIWATGRHSHDEFAAHHHPPHVTVSPFLDPMADAWAVANLAVARAGMMTIAELCAWGIPSLLVPLPSAAADHQTRNAEALEQAGASVHLPQAGLTAERLGTLVDGLGHDVARLASMAAAARARGKPEAAADIATRVRALARRT